MPPPKRQRQKTEGNGAARRATSNRGTMSVNPPWLVAAALGGYKTVPFTVALRVVAQMLSEAAVRVGAQFNQAEWGVIAKSFNGRRVEPEDPAPGHALGRMVEQAHAFYGIGSALARTPDKAVESVAARLQELPYVDAWAVVVACQFYWDRVDQLESMPGFEWWSLAARHGLFEQEIAAKEAASALQDA